MADLQTVHARRADDSFPVGQPLFAFDLADDCGVADRDIAGGENIFGTIWFHWGFLWVGDGGMMLTQ